MVAYITLVKKFNLNLNTSVFQQFQKTQTVNRPTFRASQIGDNYSQRPYHAFLKDGTQILVDDRCTSKTDAFNPKVQSN